MKYRLVYLLSVFLLGGILPEGWAQSEVTESLAASHLKARLKLIIFPEVVFNETPIEDALKLLAAKSRELDPDKEGVNLILKLSADSPLANRKVTMHVTKVTLEDVLRLFSGLTDLTYDVEDHAVVFHAAG